MKSGTVFSTELRRVCPRCGWPEKNCHCSKPAEEAIPSKITARLRISRAGRRGKTVTVIESLPRNEAFLKECLRELKKACGSGGAIREGTLEIQGDHRERLRELLRRKGWTVKG